MSTKPKILCVCNPADNQALVDSLVERYEVVVVKNPLRALKQIARENYAGVYVDGEHLEEAVRLGQLSENERMLEAMPDGVALLDAEGTILWANECLRQWASAGAPTPRNIVGDTFYAALGNPEILGPDYSPFSTALSLGQPSSSTLRKGSLFYQLHAAPIFDSRGPTQHLVVSVRDVTLEVQQQQKLVALHKAGRELTDIKPDEISRMSVEKRTELLKSNILHYTKDLLKFDVVEIRLLDTQTAELKPLLSDGMDDEAARRILRASVDDNGVTGFVAASKKSYLCEDTTIDPIYIQGVQGAKSSLTVPLMWHDEVIGTFNVESPKPRAFNESDLLFLEIFCRDVAASLNTLNLLAAQKADAAGQTVEVIHSRVALPIDQILNDAVDVLETNIGLDAEVVERLKHILRNARDIKQVIHAVGRELAPSEAVPAARPRHPSLVGKRVLVVDRDLTVLQSAHKILEANGCVVETAPNGREALSMVRSGLRENTYYDLVLSAIKLPDMSAHGLMVKLMPMLDPVPLILMSEIGWDPDHTLPCCREKGLHPRAILVKPFRVNQLLEVMECILEATGKCPAISPGA